jgi:hypothetical protein
MIFFVVPFRRENFLPTDVCWMWLGVSSAYESEDKIQAHANLLLESGKSFLHYRAPHPEDDAMVSSFKLFDRSIEEWEMIDTHLERKHRLMRATGLRVTTEYVHPSYLQRLEDQCQCSGHGVSMLEGYSSSAE